MSALVLKGDSRHTTPFLALHDAVSGDNFVSLYIHFATDISQTGTHALNAYDSPTVQLSQQERILLCNDIHRFSLLLGREVHSRDAETLASASTSQADSSPWERLLLLSNLWPRLEVALHSIVTSPDSASLAVPHPLPIHAVRGNPSTVARLARNPTDHRAWLQATQGGESGEPVRIQEERPTHSVQTPPNRIASDFLEALERETRALHRLAHFCEESAAAATAEALSQHIGRWRSQSPFRDCAALAKNGRTLAPETLLRCAPAYRSLYSIILTSQSGLHLDWSESAVLRFPALEAWHLYEIWCFLRVGIALRDLGWQPVETDCLQIALSGMHLRLSHGMASRIRFRRANGTQTSSHLNASLELFYQPYFASANRTYAQPPMSFRSLSHVMQPDIALIRNGRLLLLDPKYRSYSEVGAEQEDVDKMHAYRDAIVRTDANTGQTVPAVDAAWCLFPGVPVSANSRPEPLRAYPASTLKQPFGTAGVGAVQVRPGAENIELSALLQHWLEAVG